MRVDTNSDDDPYKNINLHKALAYENGSGIWREVEKQ